MEGLKRIFFDMNRRPKEYYVARIVPTKDGRETYQRKGELFDYVFDDMARALNYAHDESFKTQESHAVIQVCARVRVNMVAEITVET